MVSLGPFNNLKETYLEVNRYFIMNPQYVSKFRTDTMTVGTLFIQSKSMSLDNFNFGAFGYTKAKWKQLATTYIDKESLMEYFNDLKTSKKLVLTYNFKEKTTTNSKGKRYSCLLNFTLTRSSEKGDFNKLTVVWRTTELNTKWAADLFLIAKVLKGFNINEVNLFIIEGYFSPLTLPPLLEKVIGIKQTKLNSHHVFHNYMLRFIKKYYSKNGEFNSFQHLKLAQRLYYYYYYGQGSIQNLTLDKLPEIL